MANSLFSSGKKNKNNELNISKPSVNNPSNSRVLRPWKILLVDDEQDVITVSSMALKGVKFQQSELEILSASSAEEAKSILNQHSDIALALVDVVMETDTAGLNLVHWIREQQKNKNIRLILRTGQPGQAPEEEVIHKYEINDYKHKTELSVVKLKTTVLSALRSYRDIQTIASNQKRLEQILASSNTILQHSKCEPFLASAHAELKRFLKQDGLRLGVSLHSYMPYAEVSMQQYWLENSDRVESGDNLKQLSEIIDQVKSEVENTKHYPVMQDLDKGYNHHMKTNEFGDITVHIGFDQPISQGAKRLLPHFISNFALAFDNLSAKGEVEEVQQQLMMMLSEAIETRSKETGAHVLRVALICEFIGQKLGLSEKHVEVLKHAAPMHDLGKIGVPEKILHKPGPLDDDEWGVMKEHPQMGYKLLSQLKHGIPRMGAMVSLSHHEKWDGSGYPSGIAGEDIPIEGRIMAVADVVDALGSKRSYKKAWSNEAIIELLHEQKNHHFDPVIADVVIENFDQIMEIRKQYPDPVGEV